ncbi:MAG: hypothetical protein JXR76_15580 [Deltaproteobacteria bacterium]|nr:hypothetical protein [Deltaproteobacteria bacterium]
MNIPPATNPVWKEIVTGKREVKFEFLALNICMKRFAVDLDRDGSAGRVEKCISHFRNCISANATSPKVQRDMEKMFGKGDLS